jgi:ribosome biogenesis GTPase A
VYRVFLGAMELTNNLDIAKRNPHATEMNVLVIGMPNVGKSTLLNSLRNMGIPGREFNSTLVPK